MSDKPFGPSSTFGRARRREAYRRLADVVRRRKPRPLLDLDDVGKRLRVFEQSYVGIRPIPVSRIVGTLGRTGDFDQNKLSIQDAINLRVDNVNGIGSWNSSLNNMPTGAANFQAFWPPASTTRICLVSRPHSGGM